MHRNEQKVQSTILFFGLTVFSGTKESLLDLVRTRCLTAREENQSLLKIFTPNPEQIVLSWDDHRFFDVLRRGDILLPDGQGLVWGMKRKLRVESEKWRAKDPQKFSTLNSQFSTLQRIAGREVFHDLLETAAKHQWRVFLLGGKPGSAKLILNSQFSTLDWMFDDGPKEDVTSILEKIRQAKPDILFVAYGAPAQEEWILANEDALRDAGVRVAMVVGGAFEYEAGNVPQVSRLVEKLHLEWLQRLIQEPWRWRRQLNGLRFFIRVFLHPTS